MELFGLVRRGETKLYLAVMIDGSEVCFGVVEEHNGLFRLEDDKKLVINGEQINHVITDGSSENNVVHYCHDIPVHEITSVEVQ